MLVGGVFGVYGLEDPLDGDEPARLVLHEALELVVPEPGDALAVEHRLHDLLDEDAILMRDGATVEAELVAVHLVLEAQVVLVLLLGAGVADQARVLRQAPPTCGVTLVKGYPTLDINKRS